ncbi:substrate-binding domain-containing protein [Phyllobacterium sp. SB3]|uniref:substrate-binding domain-containing protein n=1 Tax=Phyllobacterium sp. SB3 TaxID=3156073 RepID=UPI0032AFD804
MADTGVEEKQATAAGGRDPYTIAILADVKTGDFENRVMPLMREVLSRQLRPVLVPATDTSLADIAALVPELAGAIVLSDGPALDVLSSTLAVVSVRERLVPDAAFDQLILDTEAVGFRVAEYIASAGRTSVALVGPQGPETPLAQGFAKGVDTYDLMLPRDFVISCPPVSEAAVATFRAFLRAASAFPQVIYCTDPAVACGVYEALSTEGFEIPNDLWVLSHGETVMTLSPFYDVTSVAAAPGAICTAALDLLCLRLKDMDGERIIRHIGLNIVARSTTEHFYMTKAVP